MKKALLYLSYWMAGLFGAATQATDLPLQHSKEYQITLRNEAFADREQGLQALLAALGAVQDDPAFAFEYQTASAESFWRAVSKYDTPAAALAASNLRLTLEQTGEGGQAESKLKLKYNCMDPDVCYDPAHYTDAFPYPAKKYESAAKLKLEADVHQNYTKYALSGSIKLSEPISPSRVAEAETYFKRLDHVIGVAVEDPLVQIAAYREWVYDNIQLKVAGASAEAALVLRYPLEAGEIPERVEFSMRIKRSGSAWNYPPLVELGQVYAALLDNDLNAWKGQIEPGDPFYRPADQK